MTAHTQEIVKHDKLQDFCVRVFEKLGVNREDSIVIAENLVMADLRGVHSHGVARLKRYVDGIRDGMMNPKPNEKIIRETPTTAVIDADSGMGQPVSKRAMELAIKKAQDLGMATVLVKNSNHYGIAGYYAMMALDYNMIGVSMTNTDVLVVPTFGRDAIIGTNPIAVAIPSGNEKPFVLDMATSVVPRGKLEVYDRYDKPMPPGWATDEEGVTTDDASRVLENFKQRAGGGLLPLGGEGEELSGHKGYGLALLVEILTGVLSGSAYLDLVYPKSKNGQVLPANLGHYFSAIRVDSFRDIGEFKADMDDMIRKLKTSSKAKGAGRIYIHGEKEFEKSAEYKKIGIPLMTQVTSNLRGIAQNLGIEYMS